MGTAATLTTVCALLLAAAQSPAQQSGQRVRSVMPKATANALPAQAHQNHVVLKIVEHRPDLAANGMIFAPDVLAAIGERPIEPFFTDREALRTIRARQFESAAPGKLPPVDLGLYFDIGTSGGAATRELVARLNALPTVELAYPRELPTPPPATSPTRPHRFHPPAHSHRFHPPARPGDILPVTPDFTSQQGYRATGASGVEGHAIASTIGGMGDGIKVLDIEWGWDFNHEDIKDLVPSALVGPPIANPGFNNHGTAVMGIIGADNDIYGITGFNQDADLLVATDYPASGYSVANAIAVGLPYLGSGDVMVLEAQTSTPLGLGPTEWNQADFDAIFIATGLGVVTVEAAGNGGVNLDAPQLSGLFNTNVRDSGAIIVGASNAGSNTRAGFSCYGNRIDANGWGSNVTTTGYGYLFNPGDVRQHYTSSFSGTSSATPIVTGPVVALRGAAEAQLSPAGAAALDMFAIRSLLRSHGTPIAGIRNRPDTVAMFAAAGLATGLTVRSEPVTGGTAHLDYTPPFTATANDLFAIVVSFGRGNVAMPAPFAGRYLLDANSAVTLAVGSLGSPPGTASITIPGGIGYYGLRLFGQAFGFDTSNNDIVPSNGAQIFVRR